MRDKSRILRNGMYCCLLFLFCYLLAWPVAQMGFVDGWSYIKMAQEFARTGHFVYNGWPVEILGWMLPWGALFIKLFGFSFMAVKLSTLPVAVATLLLFHAILRWFGIGPRNAMIGTLTLGLSPLFLPLSASFMTDVPGLFVVLLCLYCCQRALAAGSDRAAVGWLVVAAASNMVGGTARQAAWLGVLVMIPCTGWLLRKRRGVTATAVVLWLSGVCWVVVCMRWFARQPYAIPTPLLPYWPGSMRAGLHVALSAVDSAGALLLCLLLMIFPVLVAWLPKFGRKAVHYVALVVLGLLPILAVKYFMGRYAEIWLPDVLFRELSMKKEVTLGWMMDRSHSMIGFPARAVISLVVLAAFWGAVFAIRDKGWGAMRTVEAEDVRRLFWLLVPVSVGYCLLLLPLLLQGEAFDRYALLLMPFAIAACLWFYQKYAGDALPVSSVAVLVLYAVIAVAGTHDCFAWQRARLRAIAELRGSGIPRREIEGGFEYDGWTQVADGGHLNDPRIQVPRGAYHPVAVKPMLRSGCKDGYTDRFPKLDPKYAVGFGPEWCYLPSRFTAVHYTAWLPPFARTVKVERVPKEEK